jgi:hypothetical protein
MLIADLVYGYRFVAPSSGSRVLEHQCCRAASGARAAGGPCAPGRLAIDDLRSCDCRHRYPGGDSAGTSHPPASSIVTLRGQAPSICRRGKSPMSAGSAA